MLYQTWEESVEEAEEDPELAGTWADFLVLHDPEGLFPKLCAIAERLSEADYRRAFERKVDDDVAAADRGRCATPWSAGIVRGFCGRARTTASRCAGRGVGGAEG